LYLTRYDVRTNKHVMAIVDIRLFPLALPENAETQTHIDLHAR